MNSIGKGYGLRLSNAGKWGLYTTSPGTSLGALVDSGDAALSRVWHNVKLRFQGTSITCFIENEQVDTRSNSLLSSGRVGLITGGWNPVKTAMYDNFLVNTVGGPMPQPTVFAQVAQPLYSFLTTGVALKPNKASPPVILTRISIIVVGNSFTVPRDLVGKRILCSAYSLQGTLFYKKVASTGAVVRIENAQYKQTEISVVYFHAMEM